MESKTHYQEQVFLPILNMRLALNSVLAEFNEIEKQATAYYESEFDRVGAIERLWELNSLQRDLQFASSVDLVKLAEAIASPISSVLMCLRVQEGEFQDAEAKRIGAEAYATKLKSEQDAAELAEINALKVKLGMSL